MAVVTRRPGFVVAMKQYFGMLPGQVASGFLKEIRELSYEEKCQYHKMLTEQAGVDCDPPTPPGKTGGALEASVS